MEMKYLTINDYDDRFTSYKDCLDLLLKLHNTFKSQIDFSIKGKKLAVYLLTGSDIDAAYLALRYYKENHYNSMLQIYRYIIEIQSLVEYFLVLNKDIHKDISDWFNGKFIETRYKKKNKNKIDSILLGKAKIPFHWWSLEGLQEDEKHTQELFTVLSAYSHPTIKSVELGFSSTDRALNFQSNYILKFYFGRHLLHRLINLITDVTRVLFFNTDLEVECLSLSEFRVLFHEKNY